MPIFLAVIAVCMIADRLDNLRRDIRDLRREIKTIKAAAAPPTAELVGETA